MCERHGRIIHMAKGAEFFVRSYEDLSGLEDAVNIVLERETGDIIEIGNWETIHEFLPAEFLARIKQHLGANGATSQCIYLSDKKYNTMRSSQIRMLPLGTFDFDGDYIARGNSVLLTSFRPEIQSVLITSPVLANTMREVFRMAWQTPLLKNRYEKPMYSKLENMLADLGGDVSLSKLRARLVGSAAEQ